MAYNNSIPTIQKRDNNPIYPYTQEDTKHQSFDVNIDELIKRFDDTPIDNINITTPDDCENDTKQTN